MSEVRVVHVPHVEVGIKRKFFVRASGFMQYKGEVIEADKEEYASQEYKSAVKAGFVVKDSEDLDFEVCEEVDDE